jgi:hypothetical protein
MNSSVSSITTNLVGKAIDTLQSIALFSRLMGPIAYTLQAVIPVNARSNPHQKWVIAAFYTCGLTLFFFTRFLGQKTYEAVPMLDKVHRLVSSSLMTALLLLLLADICNQQQIILLCLLMCGSLQQKLSSILRQENRVQFIHAIPVIIMWITSSRHKFIDSVHNFQFDETSTGDSDWALLVAVVPVAFLAASLSHDTMTRTEMEFSILTTLKCFVVNVFFLGLFLMYGMNFPKIEMLKISKNLDGDAWTSSDVAIVSTLCVMFTSPISHDTGHWLFENLFSQMFFTVFVLVWHWYVSKNDLLLTLFALCVVQLLANMTLSSKKKEDSD